MRIEPTPRIEPCPREEEAAAAVRTRTGDENLRSHVASCPACQEAVRVARWMVDLAGVAGSPADDLLPDPRLIWLEARIWEQEAIRSRALLPLRIAASVATVASIGALAAIPSAAWTWMSARTDRWTLLVGEIASRLPADVLAADGLAVDVFQTPWALLAVAISALLLPFALEA